MPRDAVPFLDLGYRRRWHLDVILIKWGFWTCFSEGQQSSRRDQIKYDCLVTSLFKLGIWH